MSLEIEEINTGAYDNDPNADDLRAGGDTINENFGKLAAVANNVGLKKYLGRVAFGTSVDAALFVAKMNARTTEITEAQTPVLLYINEDGEVYDFDGRQVTAKVHAVLFMAGAGKYGSGDTPVTAAMLWMLPARNLLPADIIDQPNIFIEPLEVPDGENFVDIANESLWDWSDSGTETEEGVIQYYFTFEKDGEFLFAFFKGDAGEYGDGGTDGLFENDMFSLSTKTDVPPSPLPQRVPYINVKDFGAAGDGITDDRVAIMAAMASVNGATGGTIFFPPGKYLTSDRLDTTAPHMTFLGDGATLIYKAGKVGIVFMHDYCTSKGIRYEGEDVDATVSVNTGLFIQGASWCSIYNNDFIHNGHGVGIYAGNSWKGNVYSANSPVGNIVYGNSFKAKGNFNSENFAGVILGVADELPAIGNKVMMNIFDGNFVIDHGVILLGSGNNNIISDNTINNFRSYGVALYQTEFLDDYSVHHNQVIGNRIDGIGGNPVKGMGIYTQKSHYTTIKNNIITNCQINADDSGVLAQAGISIDGGTYNNVIGNNIKDIQESKPAIRVNNSFFTDVVGNTFENDAVGISVTESNDINIIANTGKNTSMASLLIIGGLTQSTLSPPYNSIPSGLRINVNGNTFTNTSADANVVDVSGADGCYIDGFNFQNNNLFISGNALNIITAKNGIISGNIIASSDAEGKSGILLNDVTENFTIAGNTIYSMSGMYTYGIYADGTTNRVLLNTIKNATTPVSNSGSVFFVDDTEMNYNKSLKIEGSINGVFFDIIDSGAGRADFKSNGDAVTVSTIDGNIFRGIKDSGFTYFQTGASGGKTRLTAGTGTAMESLNIDADNSIFSGGIKSSALPVYADDAVAGGAGLASGQFYKTSTGELRIKL